MASTSLDKTFSSAGNRRTFTWSSWIKFGSNPTTSQSVFLGYNAASQLGFSQIGFASNKFYFSGWAYLWLQTTQVFRDTSAWYHFVLAVDTTQATADDRIKMYVNGSQITDFSTRNNPSQNDELAINDATTHNIGSRNAVDTTDRFDGYMADMNFIDGQALDASYFGQTDSTGIWKPKGYSGSYGTNGFYLKFSNSGDLGADSSGNSNNFTKSGNGRQMTDTPSNVFAVLNELTTSTYPELREGNLQQYNHDTANSGCAASTIMPKEGKWYCELFLESPSSGDYPFFGITDQSQLNQQGSHGSKMATGFEIDGVTTTQSPTNLGTITLSNTNWQTFADNDIVMFCLDCDNRKWWIGRNGTWTNSGDPAAGTNQQISWTNATEVCSVMMGYSGGGGGGDQSVWNFGQDGSFAGKTTAQGNADGNGIGDFYYSPPSGFVALCTKNFATEVAPTIDDGSAYFQTKTYSGNGVETAITNDGNSNLQPDLIWFKARSAAYYHGLFDSTRGTELRLSSNTTDAESTKPSALTSFDSDGFTVGADVSNTTNANGQTFVAWQWKANGGTTSSNTDGSITSTVQANTTAGFSIVTYTGTTDQIETVGHGLGVVPKLIIFKNRDQGTGGNWAVYSESLGNNKKLLLNTTGAEANSGNFNSTTPTSSVFTINTASTEVGQSADTVAYCFAEIEGYSKIGTYEGNGSTDGTFVYTGHKSQWLIIKNVEQAGGQWFIYDVKRETFNPLDSSLFAENSQAETANNSALDIDILSNGWKIRNTGSGFNNNGIKYIYMSFAEHPLVTSGGLPVTAR